MEKYVMLDTEAFYKAFEVKLKELRRFDDNEYSAGRVSGMHLTKGFVDQFLVHEKNRSK